MFEIIAESKKTKARIGILETVHGKIKTPCFYPDATYGAVKYLSSEDLKEIGLQMLLGNVYHLGLRPGSEIIKKAGGLHEFMNWDKPILTDSGGFQAFSLVHRNNMGSVLNKGVVFYDHISGKKHLLTPETSIKMQSDMNSDILMCFDDCIFAGEDKQTNIRSVELTTKWAKLSKETFEKLEDVSNKNRKMLFGIVQGGKDLNLRRRSAEELMEIGFDGYGYGGWTSDDNGMLFDVFEYTASLLPRNKPRYLMGLGTPDDIRKAVDMGYDMFDCVIPTRNARHGTLYTSDGVIRIKNSKYKTDFSPLDDKCDCQLCQNCTKGYLHHLFKVKEPLGYRLATLHNLRYYMKLMEDIRKEIV